MAQLAPEADWPPNVMTEFKSIVSHPDRLENRTYGAYSSMLEVAFPVMDGIFVIKNNSYFGDDDSQDAIDVSVAPPGDNGPVLILEVKRASNFDKPARRREALLQLIDRITDLLQVQRLFPGRAIGLYVISAFGRNAAVYHCVLDPNGGVVISPPLDADNDDIAQWDCDLMSREGSDRMRAISKDIYAAWAAVSAD